MPPTIDDLIAELAAIRQRGRVRLASTSNISISTLREDLSVDGVLLDANDLVLLKNQTALAENGVYKAAAAASGTPGRFSEYDTWAELFATSFVVAEGTLQGGTIWRCTTPTDGTLDTTSIEFEAVDNVGRLTDLAADNLKDTHHLMVYDTDGALTGVSDVTRHKRVSAVGMSEAHLVELINYAEPASPSVNDAPEAEYPDLSRADAIPLLIDGAIRKIDPVALQEFVLGTPWALDATGSASMTATIQAKADSLLVYAEESDLSQAVAPTGITTVTTFALTVDLQLHNGKMLRCIRNTTNNEIVNIKLPSSPPDGFVCYVASMGSAQVELKPTTGPTPPTISFPTEILRRFDALKIEKNGTNSYLTTPISVVAGSTLRLPAGVFLIDGVGLKLHPAINLVGAGMAGTVLRADALLTGIQDTTSSETPALLTVVARSHPASEVAGDPVWSWQPLISGLTLLGGALGLQQELLATTKVCGILIESGTTDPRYPAGGTPEYKASSARIDACGVYEFPGMGVYSQAERQRFYCQHLRCVGNGLYGLRILGSDPVIGERTGLGSNGRHQLSCGGTAGVIVTGVNMWKGSVRGTDCLACEIRNVNGCTITGCVFNDTLLLAGDTEAVNGGFRHKGVSVTGCDFRPNDAVFSADGITLPLVANGGAPDEYNAYIFVSYLANVTIGDNSFCVQADGYKYKRILYADNRARVSLSATLSTESGVRNFFDAQPIGIGADVGGVSPIANYDLRDISKGTRSTGMLSNGSVAPQMRGTELSLLAAIDPYAGYRIFDGGPALQAYAPEFTDEAAQFFDATEGAILTVLKSARTVVVSMPAVGLNALTIRLQATTNHRHLTVLLRGGSVNALSWDEGSGVALLDDAWLPKWVSSRAAIELIRKRGAVVGNVAPWQVLRNDEAGERLFLRDGTDTTVPTVSETVPKATIAVPRRMRLVDVQGTVVLAASDTPRVKFDIRWRIGAGAWQSVFTTPPTIDKNETSTLTATNPGVLNAAQTLVGATQELGLFVIAMPTTGTLPQGLKVWLFARQA